MMMPHPQADAVNSGQISIEILKELMFKLILMRKTLHKDKGYFWVGATGMGQLIMANL